MKRIRVYRYILVLLSSLFLISNSALAISVSQTIEFPFIDISYSETEGTFTSSGWDLTPFPFTKPSEIEVITMSFDTVDNAFLNGGVELGVILEDGTSVRKGLVSVIPGNQTPSFGPWNGDLFTLLVSLLLDGEVTASLGASEYFDELSTLTITVEGTPTSEPTYSCFSIGFEPPFDDVITLEKIEMKNKAAIPVKMFLVDDQNNPITDEDISASPVVNVVYDTSAESSSRYNPELLPPGQSDDGNEFRFDPVEGLWIINLATKQFSASGQYTVTAVAGDSTYFIDSSCTGIFIRLP